MGVAATTYRCSQRESTVPDAGVAGRSSWGGHPLPSEGATLLSITPPHLLRGRKWAGGLGGEHGTTNTIKEDVACPIHGETLTQFTKLTEAL